MTDYFDQGAYFVITSDNDTIAIVRWMNSPRTNNDALDAMIHAVGVLEKRHILDIKYPHVCFKCKKTLYWSELYGRNRLYELDYKSYKKLKLLWRSQIIEFYCCTCYERRKD